MRCFGFQFERKMESEIWICKERCKSELVRVGGGVLVIGGVVNS